jgi:hypothetical protein
MVEDTAIKAHRVGSWHPEDDPPQARSRHAPGTVPTIGQIMRQGMGNWVWFYCTNSACGHYRAMALAPMAIKLGMNVPFDRVHELARCEQCGSLGAHVVSPSWGGKDAGLDGVPGSAAEWIIPLTRDAITVRRRRSSP